MGIVRDPDHSDGAPTIEGTGIRVKDVASALSTVDMNRMKSHSCIPIFPSRTFIEP